MATPHPLKFLPPQWIVTPEGNCTLTWGQARLTLKADGTIALENSQTLLNLTANGNIILEAKEHIHLNSRDQP